MKASSSQWTTRRVSIADAAHNLGLTPQAVGLWAKRLDAPIEREGGRIWCIWPLFPQWYFHQLQLGRHRRGLPVE